MSRLNSEQNVDTILRKARFKPDPAFSSQLARRLDTLAGEQLTALPAEPAHRDVGSLAISRRSGVITTFSVATLGVMILLLVVAVLILPNLPRESPATLDATQTPSTPDQISTPAPGQSPAPTTTSALPSALVPVAALGKGAVSHACLSPDGQYVAVATNYGVAVSDATTLEERWVTELPYNPAALGWRGDGSAVLAYAGDTIYEWDAVTGTPVRSVTIPPIGYPTFSPDGSLIAGTEPRDNLADTELATWDTDTGEKLLTFDHVASPRGRVSALAWSPDGATLAVGLWEGGVMVINLPSSAYPALLEGLQGAVWSIAFNRDGSRIAAGSVSGEPGETGPHGLAVWDVATRQVVFSLQPGAVGVALSPDGGTLAATRGDHVSLYDLASGAERATIAGNARHVAYSPQGDRLLIVADERVSLFDLAAGENHFLPGYLGRFLALALSPDGSTLAASTGTGFYLYEVRTGDLQRVSEADHLVVSAIRWPPGGDRLVLATGDTIYRLDLPTRELSLLAAFGDDRALTGIAVSPDGTRLAAGSLVGEWEGGSITVWDLMTGSELASIQTHYVVGQVAWSPDGTRIAALTGHKEDESSPSIRVVDAATLAELPHLFGDAQPFGEIAWSPDGRLLVAVEREERVTAWDARTGETVWQITRPSDMCSFGWGVTFSPDGSFLAIGGCEVYLVDARTGALLFQHPFSTETLFFSPDGSLLALISSHDVGVITLWDVRR